MTAKGQIVDSITGQPLPGATIAAYMTTQCFAAPCPVTLLNGTTSDVNGMFNLTVPAGTSYIEVSYVGYQKQVPVFQDGVLQRIHLVQMASDLPTATVAAKKTYYKEAAIAAVVLIALFILFYKTK